MIGLMLLIGGVMTLDDAFFNMTRPTESEIIEQKANHENFSNFVGGTFFAFLIYIVILVVTFAVRTKTKAVGITIIILGVIGMATTNLWGIIPFALLLPAGISALRFKQGVKEPPTVSP